MTPTVFRFKHRKDGKSERTRTQSGPWILIRRMTQWLKADCRLTFPGLDQWVAVIEVQTASWLPTRTYERTSDSVHSSHSPIFLVSDCDSNDTRQPHNGRIQSINMSCFSAQSKTKRHFHQYMWWYSLVEITTELSQGDYLDAKKQLWTHKHSKQQQQQKKPYSATSDQQMGSQRMIIDTMKSRSPTTAASLGWSVWIWCNPSVLNLLRKGCGSSLEVLLEIVKYICALRRTYYTYHLWNVQDFKWYSQLLRVLRDANEDKHERKWTDDRTAN